MADAFPQPSPPRRRPRFWLRFLVLIALVLAAPLAWFAIDRLRAHRRLQAAYAEADRLDPGWRYDDLQAMRAMLPDNENGALQVLAALKHFPKSEYAARWQSISFDPELSDVQRFDWQTGFEFTMRDLPGHVMLNRQQEAGLLGELHEWKTALEDVRELKRFATGRFPYTLQKGWPRYEHLMQSRTLIELLQWDVLLQSHRKQWEFAGGSSRAAFGLARAIGDEPDADALLVRIAISLTACTLIDRLVGQGEPPPELLAELRTDVREATERTYTLWIARGLRAETERLFRSIDADALQKGEDEMLALLVAPHKKGANPLHPANMSDNESWLAKWRQRASRDFKAWRAELVDVANDWTLISKLSVSEQFAAYKAKQAAASTETPVLQMTVHMVTESCFRLHAQLRATDAGLAIECYRRKHGRWPERLDDLTPEFLDAVPIDIYTGKPLVYRRHKDGVVVYSVGPDEKDNGGKLRREADEPYVPYPEGLDFGMMLWDVAKRRAPARPPLALPKPQVDEDLP
jgi:hypothetical protein